MRFAMGVLSLTVALTAPGAARAEVEWSPVTGEVTARYMGYEEDSPRTEDNHFGDLFLKLQINAQLTEKLQLVMVPLVQYDAAELTADEFRFHEEELQRPAATFEELHLTYYGDKFEISVGKQIFSWGPSAGFKPTDNLNAADFLDVPTLHKVGIPAISVLRHGLVDVQLVVAPLFSPHRLPQSNNRWTILPEDILDQIEAVTGFEPPIIVHRDLPEDKIDNVQAGLRLRSSSLVDGWDLELSAFHGHDPFGIFAGELLFPPVRIEAVQVFPEYTEIGGGFETVVGKVTIHAEGSYHRTMNSIDDDYAQYVAGLVYTLDQGTGFDNILFGLEYIGEGVDNEDTRPRGSFPSGFDRVFKNSLAGLSDISFTESLRLRLAGGVNFNDDDFTAHVEVIKNLVEGLKLNVGFDWFEGSDVSYFGNWDENDRVFVFTTYVF